MSSQASTSRTTARAMENRAAAERADGGHEEARGARHRGAGPGEGPQPARGVQVGARRGAGPETVEASRGWLALLKARHGPRARARRSCRE